MLDCQIFGLRAGGHHMVNVLWHAATAVLLFLVLRHITGSLWRSAFVAAVFAVHPLRAESVAWVSERKDVLSGFFFILTLWAYVRYAEECTIHHSPFTIHYSLALFFFVLGLLAKSMVATLPFVLLLLDYWPLGRLQNAPQFLGLVKEKIPLFVLAAGSCVTTALVPSLVVTDASRLPLLERLGNALVSYGVYLRANVFSGRIGHPLSQPVQRPATLEGLSGVCPAGGNLCGGHFVPEQAPVSSDRLALVSGDVVSGNRDHSNISRCLPCRPLHLSAGNRIGHRGNLGGGGRECGVETPAAGSGRFDVGGGGRPNGLRPHPDFVLERQPNAVEPRT